jgi:hypothetical protein
VISAARAAPRTTHHNESETLSADNEGHGPIRHLAWRKLGGHHSDVSAMDREDVLAIMTSLMRRHVEADTVLEYLGEDDEEEEDEA